MPPEPRQRCEIRRLEDELYGFIRQRNISARNIERLKLLARNPNAQVKALAEVVLEIARIKPGRRRRIRVIAERHWQLFVRMASVLPEALLEEFFFADGDHRDWLWELWERARAEARFQAHGKSPCCCGSGLAYWHCCAQRDEECAAQLADEERAREQALNPDSIPWWQQDSGVDHFTRSAFELFYADADHPLAAPPSEWRHDEVASPRREKHHARRHREPPHR